MAEDKGNLYLIPNTLGETPPLEVLPLLVKKAVEEIDHYIAEHEKAARKFIKLIVPRKSQGDLQFSQINKFTDPADIPAMLEPCRQGLDVGIISDAGCPAIADPGALVVREAHREGIRVVPLVGPSSILMALMASGMNGQSFAFNGYLPIDKQERKQRLKQLERLSVETGQSQAFIETPYRNNQLMEAMLRSLSPQTDLCVAADISLPTEYILTQTIEEWKKTRVDLNKRPTLFVLHRH
ncbi:SAM-dependent methyltransferase [Aureitalea marina]|uniref:SAM-dependent methyltransferase n=1 Tax=Aureitalea marina TaxID=930804 RepID=A0A2S7KN44_9FLAO|nr:SAM-dependent methyltransferase [Aureitalea marina]PQB04010.1 SAM-dependent methyltransferase [Aureitalea marina]